MRVLLADDHALVRGGIRALLDAIDDVDVVAETGDGREALELIGKQRPDVAVIDITMPGMNGLEVAARAAQASPKTRVLVLSVHAEENIVAKALQVKVAGYLLKASAVEELPIALKAVARGDTYLSPAISSQVVEGFLRQTTGESDDLDVLTPRQREILQLIAEGRTRKEIAQTLGVSVKTVAAHRSQLMERLGISDVPSLVRWAIRAGVVSGDE